MDWLSWLMEQAKTASPFIAVFSLSIGGSVSWVLWKQHQRDMRSLVSIGRSQARAMISVAQSVAKLSAKIGNGR